MPISTKNAVNLGFVLDRNRSKLNSDDYDDKSSFDLTIREVLINNPKTKEVETHPERSTILNPQNSAYLISEEIIRIPKGYIAYVFLKNRQSQKGLLALNTGIIDQYYYGPISTLVTNLSSKSIVIPDVSKDGKSFFRVVFHRISDTPSSFAPSQYPIECYDHEEYRKYRKEDLEKFPRTFLDIDGVEEKISDSIKSEFSSFNYVKLGTTIAFVGLLLSLLPFAKDYYFSEKFELADYAQTRETVKVNLDELNESMIQLRAENDILKRAVKSLKTELIVIKEQQSTTK